MRLGFLTKTLGTSQSGVYMAAQSNELVALRPDIELIVFYEDYDRVPMACNFSLMQNRQAWNYKGILIATDVECGRLLSGLVGPVKKFLYVWNLEWLYQIRPFEYYSAAYQNDDIELIARSNSHADLLTRIWKKPTYVIEDFNHETLAEIVDRHSEPI